MDQTLGEAELAACLESSRPRLVRIAANMLGDSAAAEDAVQDAAMKALTSSAGFRSEAQVCTWVQRICVNSCYDQLRRRKSADRRDQALRQEALWRDPEYTVNPEEVALAAADASLLREALARLSPDQSRAVVLHDVEGWTAAEIASSFKISLPAIKSHLRRGRQALVTMLAGSQS